MSIQFTKRYNALLNKAAVIAKVEGIKLIERRHLFSAICQMSPNMFNRLLERKNLVYPTNIDFDVALHLDTSTPKITFSSDAYRVLTLHGGCLGEVVEWAGSCLIDIQHVAAALLFDSDEHGPIRELLYANGINPNYERLKIIDALKSICRSQANNCASTALSKVSAVRKELQAKLVGQDGVIDKICIALLEFWSTPPEEKTRPLSIFIAGASGSGKTLLADTLISSISKLSGAHPIPILNSGMFSSRDSARDLVGLNYSWKGPKPGEYTLPISENSEGVICLDNVDTLHLIGLNHVLKAITTGWLKDDFLDKVIDFRNAICVFMSSAGGEFVSEATSTTKGSSWSRNRLAEELCSGIASPDAMNNVRSMVEQTSLPVVMKPLNVSELRVLMARSIEQEFKNLNKTVKHIAYDKEAVADLLVQTIESLDPRGIQPILDAVIAPIHESMLNSPMVWRSLKRLNVLVEGGEKLDFQRVSDNLHMRTRMTVKASVAVNGKEATLRIEATGYVMLPAIKDGIVSVTPPSTSDTFDNLVGISAPLSYANRWKRYFAGETDIRPEHLILTGPPGCGKTSFVRALAADIQKPYVILNCNDLGSPFAVITAFTIIRKYAKDGLLVFLDELDSLGGDRDGKSEGYIERLNILLQQIDGFAQYQTAKVLYIAATNRISSLDNAIVRSGRFGQTIAFSPLGEGERHELVRLAAKEYKTHIDQKLEDFIVETSAGLAPATVKATVREMAFSSGKNISSKEDYLKARRAVVEGVFTQQAELSDDEAYSVACHEAGHALCAELNNRHFVQVSVISNGGTLGFLEERDPGLLSRTKNGFLATIDISFAGRAAQDILLGQPTDGAKSDIAHATRAAIEYVESGFSEYGFGIPPDGIEWIEISPFIRKLLDERYEYVKQQLSKEKGVLQKLTNLLLKKKIVFQDELKELRKGFPMERGVSHE